MNIVTTSITLNKDDLKKNEVKKVNAKISKDVGIQTDTIEDFCLRGRAPLDHDKLLSLLDRVEVPIGLELYDNVNSPMFDELDRKPLCYGLDILMTTYDAGLVDPELLIRVADESKGKSQWKISEHGTNMSQNVQEEVSSGEKVAAKTLKTSESSETVGSVADWGDDCFSSVINSVWTRKPARGVSCTAWSENGAYLCIGYGEMTHGSAEFEAEDERGGDEFQVSRRGQCGLTSEWCTHTSKILVYSMRKTKLDFRPLMPVHFNHFNHTFHQTHSHNLDDGTYSYPNYPIDEDVSDEDVSDEDANYDSPIGDYHSPIGGFTSMFNSVEDPSVLTVDHLVNPIGSLSLLPTTVFPRPELPSSREIIADSRRTDVGEGNIDVGGGNVVEDASMLDREILNHVSVPVSNHLISSVLPLPVCSTAVAFHPVRHSVVAIGLANGQVRVVDIDEHFDRERERQDDGGKRELRNIASASYWSGEDEEIFEDDFEDVRERTHSETGDQEDRYVDDFEEVEGEEGESLSLRHRRQMCSRPGLFSHQTSVLYLKWVKVERKGQGVGSGHEEYVLVSVSKEGRALVWRMDSKMQFWSSTFLLQMTRGEKVGGRDQTQYYGKPEYVSHQYGPGPPPLSLSSHPPSLSTLEMYSRYSNDEPTTVFLNQQSNLSFPNHSEMLNMVNVTVSAVSCIPLSKTSFLPSLQRTNSILPIEKDTKSVDVIIGSIGGGVIGCQFNHLNQIMHTFNPTKIGKYIFDSDAIRILEHISPSHVQFVNQVVENTTYPEDTIITGLICLELFNSSSVLNTGLCSINNLFSYNPIVRVYDSHIGKVTGISVNSYHTNIFSTCSTDGAVKIYSIDNSSPILELRPSLYNSRTPQLTVIAWSPFRPSVLVVTDSWGYFYIYDLIIDISKPIMVDQVPKAFCSFKENITSILFCPKDASLLSFSSRSGITHSIRISRYFERNICDEYEILGKIFQIFF